MSRKLFQLLLPLVIAFTLFVPLASSPLFVRSAHAQGLVTMDPQLEALLPTATEPLEVIVTFHGDEAPGDEEIALLEGLGITQGLTFQALPIAGVLATAEQVTQLSTMPEVRSLWLNQQLEYDNLEARQITGVDRVRTDAGMTSQNGGLPVAGQGITVLVNDSGVDNLHPDLQDNVVQNVYGATNLHALSDLLPVTYIEGADYDLGGGHGTHVGGIVAGNGSRSSGAYEGVAPAADLVSYGSGAALFILDTLGGFDYALTHQFQYGIRVITNSWGNTGDSSDFNPDDPTNVASKKVNDRGIVVVFSAGNSGPGEGTITGNFKKAPWVICVAAGSKSGELADFSSRGVKDKVVVVEHNGQTYVSEDRPTVTAPGVDIISTRATGSALAPLSAQDDVALIPPAYLPYYTVLSGTSMAAPHVAGIVALLLDANPALSPAEVKAILEETATNMPGREPWEVGAGYVNAYAAVQRAFGEGDFGQTLNLNQSFNSNADLNVTRTPITISYNPLGLGGNSIQVEVPAGLSELSARVDALGPLGETGNPVNLILIAPDGTEYSSGISVLFSLYPDRTVSIPSPAAGTWTVEIRGLRGAEENPTGGAGLPEEVEGELTFKQAAGFSGLSDIAGNAAEGAIQVAVTERLVDGYADGTYRPNSALTRSQLARYLVMGAGIRQSQPDTATFSDVSASDAAFVEAVVASGAALKDGAQGSAGVMRAQGAGTFAPAASVTRAMLAYALVQSLGLQDEAATASSDTLTVQAGDERITIDDSSAIPADLRGHVQVALDLNILNAYFTLQQGPYDLQPTLHATFRPSETVTRGAYAVTASRFFNAYLSE